MMRPPNFLLVVIAVATLASCSKNRNECVQIEYNQVFTASEGETYCLPDGNEIVVEELINAFCPCDMMCLWGGEVMARMDLTIEDELIQYLYHGDHIVSVNEALPSDMEFHHFDIEFESECSESNPSPEIESLQLELRLQ